MINLNKIPQIKISSSYCMRIFSALKKDQYKGLFIFDFASSVLYITDPIIMKKIKEENIEYDYVTNPNSINYILDEEE